MTAKQKTFVQEYLIDLNATQAAIRAGYSMKTARKIGQENLTKPDIQQAVQLAMNERSQRTEITADMVLKEYAKLGFSNITDYLKVEEKEFKTESGTQLYKTVEIYETDYIDRSKMDAVAEIKQTKEGISIKLHDKKGALDSIARHLGMFVDKVQHSGNVDLYNPYKDLTPEELKKLIRDG
ncbi:phage terminase small subunit [Paenibacillus shirakamiensis]|uniref:Phage terminase small subunit n=1 Tax=Paenibacillus shirakamiensis TaxID=1265935 RepID=A0ABS4JDE0_9BACL|nr:phage terminase small subunit [Paenibacillus shirakamiensis]